MTLPAGTILRINSFYGDYVKLTRADLVTYGPGWATDFVVDNNTLIKESVSIDERMCSGDTIKYGLCEGASIEFQYFNHPNCTGGQLWGYVDVQYGDGVDDWYTIPMGCFTVKKCSRQASTGIIKVTAYNKLQSDYLDNKINDEIMEIASHGEGSLSGSSVYNILKTLLSDYSIEYLNETTIPPCTWFWLHYYFGRQVPCYVYQNPWGWVQDGYYNIYSLGLTYKYFDWSETDYYRFTATLTKLKEKLNTLYSGKYYGPQRLLVPQATIGLSGGHGSDESFSITESPDHIESKYCADVDELYLFIPVIIEHTNTYTGDFTPSAAMQTQMDQVWEEWLAYFGDFVTVIKNELNPIQKARITPDTQLSDVTLRGLQSAVFEAQCQIGQLDRVTDLFAGVELGNSRLLPAETLYPATDLYPEGARLSGSKAMYSKLWADEGNIHKWRNLIITYKGLDEEENEKEYTLQRQVNADGTDDYNCSDNWLFKNLVWTAEQIGDYADAMVAKMQGITWFPFEMWCAGLPYLETGDEIEIPLGDQKYVSYVLQRQLKGIQNLQDTYINGTLDIY